MGARSAQNSREAKNTLCWSYGVSVVGLILVVVAGVVSGVVRVRATAN